MSSTVATTLEEVLAAIDGRDWALLAIDGIDGAGKSTLGRSIGLETGASVVHLDDFLEKGQGTFLNALRYSEIARALDSSRPAIVEGVCVLEVLAGLNRTPDVLIYVRRMHRGLWNDEHELDVAGDLDSHLDHLEADLKQFVAATNGSTAAEVASIGRPRREIITYHYRYRCWERADVVFERDDA